MLILSLLACTTDTTPAWAMDPIWIEPVGTDEVHGFETWELFSSKWSKKYGAKHYVCSVVVEFSGSPTDGELCRDCTYAWDVTAEVLETDCTGELPEDPGFVSLSRVGIGPVPQDLTTDDPYPGQSQGTFVDYSEGSWVPYGWAYPESLDNRGSAETTEWDGEQAFQMWPGYVWSLVR